MRKMWAVKWGGSRQQKLEEAIATFFTAFLAGYVASLLYDLGRNVFRWADMGTTLLHYGGVAAGVLLIAVSGTSALAVVMVWFFKMVPTPKPQPNTESAFPRFM